MASVGRGADRHRRTGYFDGRSGSVQRDFEAERVSILQLWLTLGSPQKSGPNAPDRAGADSAKARQDL